jgi:hypothetical protein
MNGLEISRVIKVKCTLTAAGWDLYTSSMNCARAATALNRAVERAINSGMDRREAYDHVYKVMDKYSKFGACDTEPRAKLEDILDEVFGRAL